jgi:invasion protein IalB
MIGRLAVAALLLGLSASSARAQDAPSARASGWTSSCVSDGRAAPARCAVEQRIVLQQDNRALMTLKIELPAEPRSPTLVVQTPLGLYLPGGLTLRIDQGQPLVLAIQSCDPNGCYAGQAVDAGLLAGLKSGSMLHVAVQSLARETVDIEVPLAGFGAAYARIE